MLCGINIAQQLRFKDSDNIVVIAEDTSAPYRDILRTELLEDIDAKHTIEEAMIKHKFRLFMDVTGQRQRDRLFKKKGDFWIRRGIDETVVNKMRDASFWDELASAY